MQYKLIYRFYEKMITLEINVAV